MFLGTVYSTIFIPNFDIVLELTLENNLYSQIQASQFIRQP